jgi:hypothetical protein
MFVRTLSCFKNLTLEDKPFLFGTFVPSWKVLRVWFIWNLAFFGSWLSHYFIFGFTFLKWDNSLSMLVLDIILLVVFSSFVELWGQSCVDLILGYGLDNLLTRHTFVCHRVLFCILSKSYLHLVLESLACIFTSCISYGMFAFVDPMHRENSTIILNRLRCAWNSNSYPYAHIYVEFVLCVVVSLTTRTQLVWGPLCTWVVS